MAGEGATGAKVLSKWVREDYDKSELDLAQLSVSGNSELPEALAQWPTSRKKVKQLVRQSVGGSQREQLWLTVSGGQQFSKSSGSLYAETLQDLFGDSVREDLTCPRPFQPPLGCQWWQLGSAGQAAACRVLVAFERNHPDVSYCPDLQPFTAALLHILDDEASCFSVLSGLLQAGNSSGNAAAPRVYLEQSQTAVTATRQSFGLVASKKAKTSYRWLKSGLARAEGADAGPTATDEEMLEAMEDWVNWIYRWLPIMTVIRIMDCFLIEGRKVLYRVGLSLMKLTYRNLEAQGRRASVRASLNEIKTYCKTLPFSVLLQCAFKIRNLSSRLIRQCQQASGAMTGGSGAGTTLRRVDSPTEQTDVAAVAGGVHSAIITDKKQWDMVWQWLPTRYQIMKPRRVFTSDDDGYSLSTLYERCGTEEPLLLLVRTTARDVFGAFLTVSLHERLRGTKAFSYFGSGETFLFSLLPHADCHRWTGLSGDVEAGKSVDYFIAGDTKCLVVGGGDGYGIWLDASLDNGTSSKCTTFNNRSLVSTEDGNFHVAVIEIFTLDSE
eukprot:scpid40768/ scgid11240/ TBC1 domain family member 24